MIQVNELRIGNLIYSSSGGVKYVVGTSYKTILHSSSLESYTYYEDYDSNCEPIPLTEEILLKCGFKLSHKGFTYDKKRLSICLPCDSYKNGRVYFNSWCISEKSIDSLHQLQNLYFALTNEELTFNNL